MSKYLIRASYTVEGLKGLMKEGGSARREAVSKSIQSLGGSLEALYFAFGDTDVYVIADYPDNVSATAASLVFNAAGTAKIAVTVLLTPEEVDKATKMSVAYRAPGH
jgi:uncharacterized protein with GYD domain